MKLHHLLHMKILPFTLPQIITRFNHKKIIIRNHSVKNLTHQQIIPLSTHPRHAIITTHSLTTLLPHRHTKNLINLPPPSNLTNPTPFPKPILRIYPLLHPLHQPHRLPQKRTHIHLVTLPHTLRKLLHGHVPTVIILKHLHNRPRQRLLCVVVFVLRANKTTLVTKIPRPVHIPHLIHPLQKQVLVLFQHRVIHPRVQVVSMRRSQFVVPIMSNGIHPVQRVHRRAVRTPSSFERRRREGRVRNNIIRHRRVVVVVIASRIDSDVVFRDTTTAHCDNLSTKGIFVKSSYPPAAAAAQFHVFHYVRDFHLSRHDADEEEGGGGEYR
mmetsp:Transcript_8/g.14  ORF Transcript_8/g.14 Transcript_8/m.14 type:complete len:326 (+) Transcript_8:1942-2919(+)